MLKAKMAAGLGPVADPQDVFLELHGFPYRVGQVVIDTVTGEEVVILGGTIIQQSGTGSGFEAGAGSDREAS